MGNKFIECEILFSDAKYDIGGNIGLNVVKYKQRFNIVVNDFEAKRSARWGRAFASQGRSRLLTE